MPIKKISIKIKNRHGDDLNTDLRYKDSNVKFPLVILCHGFKGFKDWGCFPYMMDKLAEDGNFCVSFNYSYNGTGDKVDEQSDFTRLDLFAKNTFSRELDDLGSVIDYFCDNKIASEYDYDTGDITLIGHSRGGGIAILKTAEDKRIKKLITLSTVNNFDRYSDALKTKWKEAGFFEVMNSRTNQMMRMDYTLMEDLENNPERLDIKKAITKITVPVLFIHGEQDITVDYSNSEDLYSRRNEVHPDLKDSTKLGIIKNTGHTFGAVHPFAGTTAALDNVIKLISGFLKN
ncbi:MAG TPA: alpha/beta fold hydrolase [Ignavibacteria bacterium]|nr:alpha/beta fold hydrolase [Ignavibacteria bacterium]HMR41573.1 alpha/beta fold hydrolase [Ignavibacteria bacterium]